MNEILNKFLEENAELLDRSEFLRLFTQCPESLRKELLDTLDQADIQIVDIEPNSRYIFKSARSILALDDINKKVGLYGTRWLSQGDSKKFLVITETNLDKAIRFAVNRGTIPVKLAQNFVDSYTWKEIEIMNGDKFEATTQAIDYFDPNARKNNRFLEAAREEYNQRMKELTAKTFDRDKLEKLLEPFAIETDTRYRHIYMYVYPEEWQIRIKYDESNYDKILEIIKSEARNKIEVYKDPEDEFNIHVETVGPKVDAIRQEVEETFGVAL